MAEFEELRAVVAYGDGGGVIARYEGVLAVAEGPDEAVERLLALCRKVAGETPGRLLARRLAAWLGSGDAGDGEFGQGPPEELRFGTVAAADRGLAVFLSGDVDLLVPAEGVALAGADSATWTDRVIDLPQAPLALTLRGTAPLVDLTDGVFDLREGAVPGVAVAAVGPWPADDQPEQAERVAEAGSADAIPVDEPPAPSPPARPPLAPPPVAAPPVAAPPVAAPPVAPPPVAPPPVAPPPADPASADDQTEAVRLARHRKPTGEQPVGRSADAPTPRAPQPSAPQPITPPPSTETPNAVPTGDVVEPAEVSPSPGRLVFDDGTTHTVDTGYLLGREPENDARVRSGVLRAITLEDPSGVMSRVHAEIRLEDGEVLLIDSGSSNGTHVVEPGESSWTTLTPTRPHPLTSGIRVRLGRRTFTFEA